MLMVNNTLDSQSISRSMHTHTHTHTYICMHIAIGTNNCINAHNNNNNNNNLVKKYCINSYTYMLYSNMYS